MQQLRDGDAVKRGFFRRFFGRKQTKTAAQAKPAPLFFYIACPVWTTKGTLPIFRCITGRR